MINGSLKTKPKYIKNNRNQEIFLISNYRYKFL